MLLTMIVHENKMGIMYNYTSVHAELIIFITVVLYLVFPIAFFSHNLNLLDAAPSITTASFLATDTFVNNKGDNDQSHEMRSSCTVGLFDHLAASQYTLNLPQIALSIVVPQKIISKKNSHMMRICENA